MTKRTTWSLIIVGVLGLMLSLYMLLWAGWASATPAWDTHSAAIELRWNQAMVGAAVSCLALILGLVRAWRSRRAGNQ